MVKLPYIMLYDVGRWQAAGGKEQMVLFYKIGQEDHVNL
jgi:hypothetical protein